MVHFMDGPAAGQTLALRRAPVVLRVVRSRNGAGDAWDALNQLDDEAKPTEAIHVYRLACKPEWYHLCIRGKGKKDAGYYARAQYTLLAEQPDEAHTRDNAAWAAWCEANKDRLLAEWGGELERPLRANRPPADAGGQG